MTSLSSLALTDLATACDLAVLGTASIESTEQELPGGGRRRFLLFSISKTITAVAVAATVDSGLLSFETRISDVLPAFGKAGKEEITVHDVLTHTGGFPDGRPGVPPLTFTDFADSDRALAAINELPRDPALTGRATYHPLAYGVLQFVVEAVAADSFEAYCQSTIFDPLGMRYTSWGVPVDARHEAVGLTGPAAAQFDMETFQSTVISPANAWSTGGDMGRFMLMLAGGGTLDGRAVLAEQTVATMTTAHAPAHGQAGAQAFGYGLFIGSERGAISGRGHTASPSCFGHAGFTSTQVWYDPPIGVGLVVLTNSCVGQDESDLRFSELADEARRRAGARS